MKTRIPNTFLAALAGCFVAATVQAGELTDDFIAPHDYLTQSVTGTVWDGVYLGAGSVAGGTAGDGRITVADTSTFGGYLYVQSLLTDWAGNDTDGFFLYKLVGGDFDASISIQPPYDNRGFHFSGLMARAIADQSGAASALGENWVDVTRFNEFGIGEQVRFATNGVNIENNFFGAVPAETNADTNSARYLRITRTGNTFTFFNKTNASDSWNQLMAVTRPELDGVPVQVGPKQATFSDAEIPVYFSDFRISGPNIGPATPPADPSGLAATPSGATSLNVSWTPGTGSAGSIVLVRANGSINHEPANGFTYLAGTNFLSSSNLLGGAGVHVAYVGSGNSVTIGGLGGDRNTYHIAVYSYSGTGAATVYGATPATAAAPGPGTLSSITISLSPTNLPVAGVAVASLTAHYSSGESYNVSAEPSTLWQSNDPSVVSVEAGVLNGLNAGSTSISATYNGITGSKMVVVSAPTAAFSDNFGVAHNYVAEGLPGSAWDGVYLGFGDIPNGNPDGGEGVTTVASAHSVTNNALVVTTKDTSWAGAGNDGFLLYKQVSGDFQASVHIKSMQRVAYQFAGLMARAAEPNGAAFGGSENWVYWGGFGQFNVSGNARTAVNGADTERTVVDGNNTQDFWMLMQRVDGTNFLFFRKINETDPWTYLPNLSFSRPDFAGVPLQVGLFEATYTGNTGTTVFESFRLVADGFSPTPPPAPASGLVFSAPTASTLTLTWTPGAGSEGSVVVMRAGKPVNHQPIGGVAYVGNPGFGLGPDLGGGNHVVYSGTGSSVVVTNLTPGSTYYAAVYSLGGSGPATIYNLRTSAAGSLVLGQVQSISLVLPTGGIPAGGLGKARVVLSYSGGISATATTGFTLSSGDTNVVRLAGPTSPLLTGVSNGTTTVTAIYTAGSTSFTNSVTATVRTPKFKDGFANAHDFKASGVAGSGWDGVYTQPGTSVPGTTYASSPSALIGQASSETNVLTISTLNVGWEGAQNDGFFLYKDVPGDFQMAVHVGQTLLNITPEATNVVAIYNNPGLLARAYRTVGGVPGAPFTEVTNNAVVTAQESWISWTRFDEFGIGTYARRTLNNGTQQNTQPAAFDGEYWLLMVRENGTNFTFYQRKLPTDPWKASPNGTTYNVAAFAGRPMQVGLLAGAFNSDVTAITQFDTFMLDAAEQLPVLAVGRSPGNIDLSWTVVPGFNLVKTTTLGSSWTPVDLSTAVTNNGVSTLSLPTTNSAAFFELVK